MTHTRLQHVISRDKNYHFWPPADDQLDASLALREQRVYHEALSYGLGCQMQADQHSKPVHLAANTNTKVKTHATWGHWM